MKTTLGGDRLGSGNQQDITLRSYERSTHDLSYIWRSTMASGTLVPFLKEVALPGDTFDIDLNAHILTHPTIGPLFGSFKVQLDVFEVPIRLYQAALQMNMANIGLEMEKIMLPQIDLKGNSYKEEDIMDASQVNPSALMAYLGVRGLGQDSIIATVTRWVNAVPLLGYWDIYKNYYANKQEEIGVVIHNDLQQIGVAVSAINWSSSLGSSSITAPIPMAIFEDIDLSSNNEIIIYFAGPLANEFDIDLFTFAFKGTGGTIFIAKASEVMLNWNFNLGAGIVIGSQNTNATLGAIQTLKLQGIVSCGGYAINESAQGTDKPRLVTFPLENIDTVRLNILQNPITSPYVVGTSTLAPYGLPLNYVYDPTLTKNVFSLTCNQEGLGIKTYQSDLYNNWLNSIWIDGVSGGYAGINMISSISTAAGFITINEINLKKKIYDMLNRVAVSDGSYDSWLDATYDNERYRQSNNPVYCGGLSKELVFQEVISNSGNSDQPLGSIAGRGTLSGKHKGGKIKIKIDEPSYIMGIVSLTPRLDYSQGNKWDINLQTMNDFHKPALDSIGFQDLPTEQMAWWETQAAIYNAPTSLSAGKVPAWINYMTNVNQVYGNFAMQNEQMYMVLARRYEPRWQIDQNYIKDLTTYVDPSKFNYIFADTRLDAQNFWVQIGVDIKARRKMSAKVIPNL